MKWIPSQSLNFGIICFTEKLTNIINGFQIGVFPDSLAAKSDLQLYFHGLVVKIRMWKNLGDFFLMLEEPPASSLLFLWLLFLSSWEEELQSSPRITRPGTNSRKATLRISLFLWRFYGAESHITSRLSSFIWERNHILHKAFLLGPHLPITALPVYSFFSWDSIS